MTRPNACVPPVTLYTSLLALSGAAAQESAVQTGNRQPDQVYAYGLKERAGDDVGSAVTVITSADIIAQQYPFVADAVKDSPGVALARNGALGGFASARLRGGTSGQTLVVIDGIVVNDPSAPQGGYNFANLNVADIDQIEILRGPQSLNWGADAIGGVISIRTRDDGPPVSGYAEAGSRGTVRGGASLFGGDSGAFIRATVSGVTSDGVSHAAGGAEKDGYRSIAGSLTGGAALGANADLRVLARISDSRSDIDGFPPPFFSFSDTAETEDTTDYAIAARLAHRSAGRYEGALSVNYNKVDRSNHDLGVETFAAAGDRLSANYWGSLQLSSSVNLEAGAEAERTSATVSGVDDSANAGAVFAMIEAAPFDNLILSAGARRDEFSNFQGATTSRVTGVWTVYKNEMRGDAARFRASWGEGFRAPTLFELNFDQFGVLPNPDLRPERARGFDVGVDYQLNGSRPGGGRLRATYFHQRVKDQIDFDFVGNGYFNIDRVNSDGVEVEASWAAASFLTTRVVYTYVDAHDAITGAPILRIPKHGGSASLSLTPVDPLLLSATLTFNGREADLPAPNESFVRLDLRAAYSLSDRLTLYGRVENATDKVYQDVSGYGEPGVSAFAGVRINL